MSIYDNVDPAELERALRAQMGDDGFESLYRSCYGHLRADRLDGGFPDHTSVLLFVQQCSQFITSSSPDPDSIRIIQGSRTSSPRNTPTAASNSSRRGGCYIATAIYGSYSCPQVCILRRYRDYTLASKWYGRLFIRVYYATSPTLVRWFSKTDWFKCMWQGCLDRIVHHLQEKGVADTPYKDC